MNGARVGVWMLRAGMSRPGILISVFFMVLFLLDDPGNAEGSWMRTGEPDSGGIRTEAEEKGQGFSGTVRITFLGDCTLGGVESQRNAGLGFVRRIEENGTDFPFRGLKALTAEDDLTVANLEGVLSDRKLKKVKKKYNFIGSSSYTEILKAGSVECVTLANNHSGDYGEVGYADTADALTDAEIAWFGTDDPIIWMNGKGLKIGFLGVNYSLTGDRAKRYREQMRQLRSTGCAAVITVMHAGTEYSYKPPDDLQRQIVERAVSAGTDLIIGHHPHVVQGYTVTGGVPVVYSLGNCVFGGTTHAKDSDALIIQAGLCFQDGKLTGMDLHFYPISITSDERYNNYSPRLLTGSDAGRVLKKIRESTGMDPGVWTEETGAVVHIEQTLENPEQPF